MFYKLALNNVKKSLRDYAIYFITLTFGVCIFYVFNSIESQQSAMIMSESKKDIMQVLTMMIGYISVFISIILGFLILFANKFLIKRRKKELGIYMILGMQKSKISKMIILETIIIGIFSLIIGLIAGVLISQGLSVFTAKLFEADMSMFTFIFSFDAFVKSIIYFGIIYLIVMIFNAISISKYKLINLINASKQNETFKMKKLWISVVLFIVSIICIGIAYYLIIQNGMLMLNAQFAASLIFGAVGTFLFFMSLSGFLLRIVKSSKKVYFSGLNMFVLRQINSKINTTFISMSVICLMLLITIGTLSVGISSSSAMSGEIQATTPFDLTMQWVDYHDAGVHSIYDKLKADGIAIEKRTKEYYEFNIYNDQIVYDDIYSPRVTGGYTTNTPVGNGGRKVPLMKLSDYNMVLNALGKSSIDLADNQFILNCDFENATMLAKKFLENTGVVNINGQELTSVSKQPFENTIITLQSRSDSGTLIVSDKVLSSAKPVETTLNLNFKDPENDTKALQDEIQDHYGITIEKPFQMNVSKQLVYDNSISMKAMLTFLSMYIGIVFLISSAAVLALQQLSEASDNAERYSLLRKLGADKRLINQALFRQILIYFAMPLALAAVHSIVGIMVSNNVVAIFGKIDILSSTFFTASAIILLYGGYFIATYLSSKNIIRAKKSK